MKNKAVDFVLLLKLRVPIVLLAVLAFYYLAAGKTWAQYTEYRSLKTAEGLQAAGVSKDYTGRRQEAVSRLFRRMEVDTLKWKSTLWNYASELSQTHHAVVNSFPPVEGFPIEGDSLLIQTLVFKGGYPDLMRILTDAGRKKHIGLIQSVKISRKVRDKDIVLSMDIAGKVKE